MFLRLVGLAQAYQKTLGAPQKPPLQDWLARRLNKASLEQPCMPRSHPTRILLLQNNSPHYELHQAEFVRGRSCL